MTKYAVQINYAATFDPTCKRERKLYHLTETVPYRDSSFELKETAFVVVSKINYKLEPSFPDIIETYIFPADSTGDVISFIELEGSKRGEVTHEEALLGLGFEVYSTGESDK